MAQKKPIAETMCLPKKHNYIISRKIAFGKSRKKEKMDSFIICFSLIAIMYVLTLTFVGKRARKKEEPKRVYSKRLPWEEKQIAYNRMHGLPDDAI